VTTRPIASLGTASLGAVLVLAALLGGCSTDGDARPDSTVRATTPVVTGGREWDGIAEPVWERDAYGGAEVRTALGDIAGTGAAAVSIVPTWYVDDTSTSLPARDPEQTATDDSLRAAIAEAHRLGMNVLLKPHVDRHDDGDRAEIVPDDPAAWFGRYRDMMVGYARLAQETGVELLSVGTELAGTMDHQDEWFALVDAVRAVYSGRLTYAANFDSYADVPLWPRLDVIGVDAYFELVDTPTTDVDRLADAWSPVLDAMSSFAAERDKPVLFTEAGFVSQVGTTTEPWNWEVGGARSDEEQAAGYRALFRAIAGRPFVIGVQWWMWDDLADTGEDQSLDYTPHGKAAEDVLRAEWSMRAAPR